MALLTVWPTDAADGSVANEARWRKMARLWSPTGVRAGVGSEMLPTLAGLNLTVRAGACWIDGHYCELGTDQVLPVTADGLAVVRFDPVANTAELLWRAGVGIVPTMNPTGVWELPLAAVGSSFMADRRMFVMDNGLAAFSQYARDLSLPNPPEGVSVFLRDVQQSTVRLSGAWKQVGARVFGPAVGTAAWGPIGATPADIAGSLIGTPNARPGSVCHFHAVIPVVKDGTGGNAVGLLATGGGSVFYSSGITLPANYIGQIVLDYWTPISQTSYKLQVSCNSGSVYSQSGPVWTFAIMEWPS